MSIERVGIIGAGTMGNGIAHLFARCGFEVLLCDVEQRFLDRGLETIGENLLITGKTAEVLRAYIDCQPVRGIDRGDMTLRRQAAL